VATVGLTKLIGLAGLHFIKSTRCGARQNR